MSRRTLLTGFGATAVTATLLGRGTWPVQAASSPAAESLPAEVATTWFDTIRGLVPIAPGFSPPVAARALAYAGLTLYEAVVVGSRSHRSLHRQVRGMPHLPGHDQALDWTTVANAALADIVARLIPTDAASARLVEDVRERFDESQRRIVAPRVFERSVARGRLVAREIFGWSRGDGGHEACRRNVRPGPPRPVGPGLWVPTPPNHQGALLPSWGSNRCFTIQPGEGAAPDVHPAYSEDRSSPFFGEAQEVYETSRQLTPEQEAIARFWSDDPGRTATPAGHTNSVLTQVLRRERASLMTAAEAYAKVGMAVSDAFVACWRTKYEHNLLRPVTYIQATIDPSWMPLLTTPPFPEFPSGHSVQSGAAAEVLSDLFGADHAFEDRSPTEWPGDPLPTRSFDSFHQAAEEAALSRLYGGIHFRSAIEIGLAQGRTIGAAANRLRTRR
jgi:hypothetical protein